MNALRATANSKQGERKMSKEEFLVQMQDVLQTDTELSMETVLGDLDEWDSLSMMATMAFLDKNFGVKVPISVIKTFASMGDIAAKAGV
jgi:acyl carrier protein